MGLMEALVQAWIPSRRAGECRHRSDTDSMVGNQIFLTHGKYTVNYVYTKVFPMNLFSVQYIQQYF